MTFGKREQFVRPTIATALVLIAFLSFVNPEARIAQLNQRRTDADLAYLQAGLSEDAARVTGFISCELRADGFRSWNLSRHLANRLADASCTD